MAKDDEERVMLQNPNTGRDDLRIKRSIYDPVRAAILDAITEAGEIAFSELNDEVEGRTPPELWENASVAWYTVSVKLDLEAKGLIVKEGSPQRLRLG